MEQLPIRLGRVYLESEDLGVNVQSISGYKFTHILRMQLILEGDHKFQYEIVGVSPKFDEIGVVGMLEELWLAKNMGIIFIGCPEYSNEI